MCAVLNKKEVWRIEAGSVGSLNISIPIVTFGKSKPVLTLLSGIHGDEVASLFLFRNLIQKLEKTPELSGTINLAHFVNPLAFASRNRVAIQDNLDMNRIGSGAKTGGLAERILYRLTIELLSKSDFIVDIHELEMHSALLAVLPIGGSVKTQLLSKNILAAFEPELIWCPDLTKSGNKYSNILIFSLLAENIPSLMVELPASLQMNAQSVGLVAERCLNIARVAHVLDSKLLPISGSENQSLAVERRVVTADESGLFYPHPTLKIRNDISVGDWMGNLIGFPEWTPTALRSEDEGILMELRSLSAVSTGTNLFSVGKINTEITAEMNALHEETFKDLSESRLK